MAPRTVRSTTSYASLGSPDGLREVLLTSRRAVGLTQEGLSERSGVSVRTIRNLEAGTITSPRERTTELLLEALNVGSPLWGSARLQRGPGAGGQNRLVGRDRDLEHLDRALQRSRVVVLTGPGGTGKTRLATEFGDRAFGAFQHGVLFAQVGTLAPDRPGETAEGLVRAEIEATLLKGLPDPGVLTSPLSCPEWSAQPADLLLIIDNAEHVLGSAAQVVRSLLAEMPGLHIIVTSRRPLPLTLAQHWEVRPLAYDPAMGEPGFPAAVELFLQRAEASCPTLDLSGNMSSVANLCRRLDGLPFALELAATRVRSVPIETLLTEDSISRVLGAADFNGLPHQGSLFDSARWSYDLLTEEERAVLHQLTRFSGHFTFEEAQKSITHVGVPTADMLAALVDSSLVQVVRRANYWYRLPNLVREFLSESARCRA